MDPVEIVVPVDAFGIEAEVISIATIVLLPVRHPRPQRLRVGVIEAFVTIVVIRDGKEKRGGTK